jgi:hypothetical protein
MLIVGALGRGCVTHFFSEVFLMASTRSTPALSESIHFSSLEFAVTNDGECRPTTDIPVGDELPQLMPDE